MRRDHEHGISVACRRFLDLFDRADDALLARTNDEREVVRHARARRFDQFEIFGFVEMNAFAS